MEKSTGMILAHAGEEYDQYYNAIVPPIFMNSLNIFPTVDAYYDSDKRDRHTYCYGRVQNPTVRILEEKINELEKGHMCSHPGWRQLPQQSFLPVKAADM